MTPRRLRLVVAPVLLCAAVVAIGGAQAKRSWSEEKCLRYGRDWNEALRRFGPAGFSPEFLSGGAAFIRSGCERDAKVCPRTAKDRELVDVLAIRVVNEGMSTTFLPFDCPPSP
jgi:hypothetical protein